MFDLRVPSGWYFLIMGVILTVVGLFSGYSAPLTAVNANLYSGVSMLIFGGLLLWLARRAS
jgi:xanthine/uracil permease